MLISYPDIVKTNNTHMTYTDHFFDLLTIIEHSSQISRLLISKLSRWVYLFIYLLFATLFHKKKKNYHNIVKVFDPDHRYDVGFVAP